MNINDIKSPQDIKGLSIEELTKLSGELREVLLKKLSDVGGHNGPNLGMVEATVAMHYVFDSPQDKIVYDISHQSYVHKMLTGRIEGFTNPNKYKEISGYTNPKESEHDFFTIGHTSTSVSLASGLAKARDLKKEKGNVIAVIGDGSLSGGEAYEGLSYIGEQNTNMIILVNDNDQSIAENHGGLYENLRELRETNGQCQNNFFKSLNLDYTYVADGHDIGLLVDTLKAVKDSTRPVVVHMNTTKGKGFLAAEQNREKFHAGGPIDLEKGDYKTFGNMPSETYISITNDFLMEKMKKDSTVVTINAGTPSIMGFTPQKREEAGAQFVDVGIAEEHEIAMASGIAKNGGKPVVGVASTFMLRMYDQISSDLCLNNNAAVILVYGAGSSFIKDETHLGFFDIAMISNIPNLVYLAPTTKEEHLAQLEWAIEQNDHPVAIRVPVGTVISNKVDTTDYSKINKFEVTNEGNDVALVAVGNLYEMGKEVCEKLNGNITLINPKFVTGLDNELLEDLKENHKLVITLEDGLLDGGFGQKVASFYGDSDMKVKNLGIDKKFHDRYEVEDLFRSNGMSVDQIVEYINRIK